jgi:hypothetical protein
MFLGNWVVPGTDRSTVTDSEGRFRFSNVPAGEYIVFAGGDAYVRRVNDKLSTGLFSDYARHITLRSGEAHDVALSLFKLAKVRGVVRGSDGQPISGINVSVGYIEYPDGQPEWSGRGSSVKTDDRGAYQIDKITPGSYYIAATFDRTEENSSGRGAYFPEALTTASATMISLTNGSDVTADINVPTNPAALRIVSGKAMRGVLPEGASWAAGVTLVPRGKDVILNAPVCFVRESAIGASGEFRIPGVHAGTYELYVVAVHDFRTYWGNIPLVVKDTDLTDIAVSIDKRAVPLTVQWLDNGTVPSHIKLVPRMETSSLSAWCSLNREFFEGPAEPVRRRFNRVPPGTYDLLIHADGQYVADIRQEGRSIFDSGLVITDTPPQAITVVMRRGGGSIEVRTLGERTRSGLLILVPDPLIENRSAYEDINTSGSSSLTFENVRPGRYKVFAVEGVLNLDELNPESFAKHYGEGISVTVRDGETVSARVNLIPK